MSAIRTEGRTLLLPSGKSVTFEFPIQETLQADATTLVLLDVPDEVTHNENVYGVAADGKIVWRLEVIKHSVERSPYGRFVQDKGRIGAHNWDGGVSFFDPATGEIYAQELWK